MQVEVDQDLCISCGSCVNICPEVFDWDSEEKAYSFLDDIPENLGDHIHEAIESCPTGAIYEN